MRTRFTGARGFKTLFVFASSAIITTVCLFFSINNALAQGGAVTSSSSSSHESERAAQVRALNNSVLQLHGQLQRETSGVAGVRNEAATVLVQRAAALQALVQEEPRIALSFAFSKELLVDLAAKFPDSTTQLESHVILNGPIEHWIFDSTDLKSSRSLYKLKIGQQMFNLYFAGQEPSNLPDGYTLRATGVVVGHSMAVETSVAVLSNGIWASSSAVTSAFLRSSISLGRAIDWPMYLLLVGAVALAMIVLKAGAHKINEGIRLCAILAVAFCLLASNPVITSAQTAACSTIGVQNVAVLLVTFPGVAPPANITRQSVYDMFFSTTGPSLDGYLKAGSYGQTSASGNVFGWYTLDSSYADCTRLDLLRDAAIAAAANSGVAIQTYNRIFIVTTDFGCGWTGLAINSCTALNSPSGTFTASTSFLDASWQRSQTEGAENAAHEAGHNMGLAHAQSRTFGTEPLGPLGAAGTLTEYGDPFSDMSCSNIGHYALSHKAEILNWISSGANYQVVQSSGTWTLQPLEVSPSGLVALKVQRGTGNNAWLWVEYRQPISLYDSIWDPAGALVHYEDSTTGTHTQLLDFTPATSGLYDGALMPGNTWVDPYTNVSIAVQSASPSALTLSVNYGATPCTSSAPSVTMSPFDPSIYPGQSASYSVSVTNNDSLACASSTIDLTSSEPAGWSTALSTSSVTLNPGQSASLGMSKGAPSGTPAGTYAVNLDASNNSASGTGTANATVMTAPSLAVSVSVTGSTFSRPGSVPITAAVSSGGIPASGASVTFTVTMPDGTTNTQSATTGSNGTATWNYKLNQHSLMGSYVVTAEAALTSGSRKSASTPSVSSNVVTFSVQ